MSARKATVEVDSYVAFDGTGRVVVMPGRSSYTLSVAEAEALRDELSAALERLETWDQADDSARPSHYSAPSVMAGLPAPRVRR